MPNGHRRRAHRALPGPRHGDPVNVPAAGVGTAPRMTCWRPPAEWHEAGVWQRLHEVLPADLRAAGKLDWSKAVIDGSTYERSRTAQKPAWARSTAPRPAPNTTSSPTARASHSPSA